MLATLALLAAADLSGMVAIYWVCLIVGGGLLLVSMIGGLEHASADVDAAGALDTDVSGVHDGLGDSLGAHADAGGADISADATDAAHAGDADFSAGAGHVGAAGHVITAAHGHQFELAKWFSIRFMVFFLAAFGAFGVILTYFTATGRGPTLVIAIIAGVLVGQGVHHLLRTIRRTSGDSTPQPLDYVNKLGRVTIGIVYPQKGEVMLNVRGSERFVPAVTAIPEKKYAVGDEVVVVAYRSGIAEVVSQVEYRSLIQQQVGGQS